MNLGEFAIKKSVITWSLTLVLLVGGLISYGKLSRLEDPEFTIKDAIITTPYPGASAAEVEEEISDLIEIAAQQLGQLKRVESTSSRGFSMVKAKILDKYDAEALPQVWDELRRKVNDAQSLLPPGAGPTIVNDDFGDVFGVYLALTGEGYSYAELKETAKLLRRELLLATDVKKIDIWGDRTEAIYVEMSRDQMATLGISQDDIFAALRAKNVPVDAGRMEIGLDYIPINPTGLMTDKDFGELLVSPRDSSHVVFLRDVATIRRDYVEPPGQILRYNGEPAVGLGISTQSGGNVVLMGEALDRRLADLQSQIPLGMELHAISDQPQAVIASINGFIINLVEAVVIVIVVLAIFMGLRSALLIGGVLVLSISGTFLLMDFYGVTLERISLGALIIALGMLVDNAIVIVDGMQVRIESGEDRLKAASAVVGKQTAPLLGATIVAIVAFAAIGTSDDSTGEYCRSLFTVIMFSLGMSWVTAVTTTPLLGYLFLKSPKEGDEPPADPYAGIAFRMYRAALRSSIRMRWVTVAVVIALFATSVVGFGNVKNMFFPSSTRAQFFIDVFMPDSWHIEETERAIARAEEYLMGVDGVTQVSSAIGGGDLRFLLTYTPNPASSGFGVIFVDVDDFGRIEGMVDQVQRDLDEILSAGVVNVRKFRLGPGEGGLVQVRISGTDRAELRRKAEIVKNILREEGGKGVRDEWYPMQKVVQPVLAEAQARQLGIERPDIARAVQANFEGVQTGLYREGDELLPIMARAPEAERFAANSLQDLQIWSPVANRNVPLNQVLSGFETSFEDGRIFRFNRVTTMKVHADPSFDMLTSELIERAKPRIEMALGVDVERYLGRSFGTDADPYDGYTASTIPIKDEDQLPLKGEPGYFMAWGGESEDGARAQVALASSIPTFLGLMVLIVVWLFNAVRQPLIIFLTVPLCLIGITGGLLTFDQPFGFMALLGALSLSGMIIKNAIVLIDEIDGQIVEGKDRLDAVVDSGVARMRPVMMAALTTILGMLPLLTDAFFVAMAVTIMAGLMVATVLTLIFVPVLYAIFFRIPYAQPAESV